ncbi:MAG TPA: type II CAAX endopeptidase family protein [Gammaproteobacteria bacterium]|nr:type II CAAX endopeptidase family protein [Gammaproteobacteria bacterium]
MGWVINYPLLCLCYATFYATVVSLWLSNKIWPILLGLFLGLALISQQVELMALLPIFLLAFCLIYQEKILLGFAAFFLCLGLDLHLFPGFHNLKLLNKILITPDALPFTLYLNIDKTLEGILILGLTLPLIRKRQEWIPVLKKLIPSAFFITFIIMLLAYVLGFIKLAPKLPNFTFIWFVTNLLFTCMAEEAFFRGFIQKNLASMMSPLYGNYLAIFLAGILFGLMHYPAGLSYVLLATLAGLGYGWVYYKAQRIEASIITHFMVNLTHFIFFTYPALLN